MLAGCASTEEVVAPDPEAEFLAAVKADIAMQALASGLNDRYGCSNFGPGDEATAISIDSLDLEPIAQIGSLADSYFVTEIRVAIDCEGGPSIVALIGEVTDDVPVLGFHLKYALVDDHGSILELPDIEVESPESEVELNEYYRALVNSDPFIRAVYPAIAAPYQRKCRPGYSGELSDYSNPNRYAAPMQNRITFILRCETDRNYWLSYRFDGWYDAGEDAIDWFEIRVPDHVQ